MNLASRNTDVPRVSALQRLGQPAPGLDLRQRLSAPGNAAVTDARELLANRHKSVFDARQLLSRSSSKASNLMPMSITVRQTNDEPAKLNTKNRVSSEGEEKSTRHHIDFILQGSFIRRFNCCIYEEGSTTRQRENCHQC